MRQVVAPQQVADQQIAVERGQRLEHDLAMLLAEPFARRAKEPPCRIVIGTKDVDEENAAFPDEAQQALEKLHGRLIRPVEILEQEGERSRGGDRLHELAHALADEGLHALRLDTADTLRMRAAEP